MGGGSYPSAEVQSVYSTAPADWAIFLLNENLDFLRMHFISARLIFLRLNQCLLTFIYALKILIFPLLM